MMWYFYSLFFFRILASVNIAKILTTGPRLVFDKQIKYVKLTGLDERYKLIRRLWSYATFYNVVDGEREREL